MRLHSLLIRQRHPPSNLDMEDCVSVCRHQHYLELVIEQKDAFDEIGDIIKRHTTLATTNEDLRQQQQAAAEETERIRYTHVGTGPQPANNVRQHAQYHSVSF